MVPLHPLHAPDLVPWLWIRAFAASGRGFQSGELEEIIGPDPEDEDE